MHSLSINCRVLVCCTCHFQGGSPFFVYFGFLSLQVSSVSNFHWHKGVKVVTCLGSLFSCAVEREWQWKYCWYVWEVLAVDGPHCVCNSPMQHVFPGSTLLRVHSDLQRHCPKWALHIMHFPGLSHSDSQVLCKSTHPDGLGVLCHSQVQATQATRCLENALSQVACVFYAPPWSQLLGFPGATWGHSPRCTMCLLWGVISGCDTPGGYEPPKIPGRHGEQQAACSQFGGRCGLWVWLQWPLAFWLWLLHTCLSAAGKGGP